MIESAREAELLRSSALVLQADGAKFELLRIAGGEFVMGSPPSELGHQPNETPLQRVKITRPFYLGRCEVTRAQYRQIMNADASARESDDAVPISQITYAQAVAFCARVSERTGVKVALPTEAQWEYACRAGTQTPYSSGSSEAELDRVGWYDANSQDRAHPVGQKAANPWGLYDMHGNVWEYCADYFEDFATVGSTDPVGQQSPYRGAMRGGGWTHSAVDARAARRMPSDDMFGGAGLRIAVDPAQFSSQ